MIVAAHGFGTADQADTDLLGPIRSVQEEAQAKISEHVRQNKATRHSLTTETLSNIIFAATAYSLNLQNIEHALLGAMLVYAPLGYEFWRSSHDKRMLIEKLRAHKKTGDAKVFDEVGLTFRGNRPLQDEVKQEPFIMLSELAAPLRLRENGTWTGGVAGSTVNYLRYTAQDLLHVATSPVRFVQRRLRKDFNGNASTFIYTEDPNVPGELVIRTRLKQINASAIVQMPAHPDRLEKSTHFTVRSMRPEYAKIAANTVGIVGAAEFCMSVGADIWPNIQRAMDTQAHWYGGVAGLWGLTVLVGLGPCKHFMDDAKKIHKRLKTQWQITNVKREAVTMLKNTARDIGATIRDYHDQQKLGNQEQQQKCLDALAYLITRIDKTALPEDTIAFLQQHSLLQKESDDPVAAQPEAHTPSLP